MRTKYFIMTALLCAVLLLTGSVSEARTRKTVSDSTATPAFVWPRLRIGVDLGGAYAIGGIDKDLTKDLQSHEQRLRFGLAAGADVSWFFMKSLGVGLKGKLFYSYSTALIPFVANISESIKIPFFGPMICTRVYSRSGKHCFVANLSAGYCGFFNDFYYKTPGQFAAGTLGVSGDLGYDLRLSKHLSLGFQLSVFEASLYSADEVKVKHEIINQDSVKETWGDGARLLSYIDFTIGLRYNLECRGRKK